jgi:hypothetical protein
MKIPVWDEQTAQMLFDCVLSLPVPLHWYRVGKENLENYYRKEINDLLFNSPNTYEYDHAINGFVTICRNLVHGDPIFRSNIERVRKSLESLAKKDLKNGICWALTILPYIKSM